MAITLTNAHMDRLAAELDEAGARLQQLAVWHARYSSAMQVTGEWRMRDYHEREASLSRASFEALRWFAERLRAREPLWEKGPTTSPVHQEPDPERPRLARAAYETPAQRRRRGVDY